MMQTGALEGEYAIERGGGRTPQGAKVGALSQLFHENARRATVRPRRTIRISAEYGTRFTANFSRDQAPETKQEPRGCTGHVDVE